MVFYFFPSGVFGNPRENKGLENVIDDFEADDPDGDNATRDAVVVKFGFQIGRCGEVKGGGGSHGGLGDGW